MESKLERLATIKKELDQNLMLYQRNHALWAKWLQYAKKQPWFDDWAFDQAMRPSDLKADPRYVAKAQRNVVPDFAFSMGAIYYSERHSYAGKLEALRHERSKVLHSLWVERNSEGEWVYSLAEIADAYGISQDGMYKVLMANEWFFARKSPVQTHIPKKYLKKHS